MDYCTRIQNIIDEADKPDLIPHEAASHLRGCRECRSFAAERTKLHELMALSARVTAPVNFNVLLNEKLSRVKAQKSSWLNSRGFASLGTATAVLALALLAAQYSGLLSSKPGNNVDQNPPTASATDLLLRPTTPGPEVETKVPRTPTAPNVPVNHVNTDPRVAARAPREFQGRGIPRFIVRDQGREVEVPMMPVSVGLQQQVLNYSGRQLRSSDISY